MNDLCDEYVHWEESHFAKGKRILDEGKVCLPKMDSNKGEEEETIL